MLPFYILYDSDVEKCAKLNLRTAVLFITSVSTIIVMVADESARNTLAVTALKLTAAAPPG